MDDPCRVRVWVRRQYLDRLMDLVAVGKLVVALDHMRWVGLEQVPDAVERLQGGGSSGKVVVQVSPVLPQSRRDSGSVPKL